jgi:hypothetical protein
MSTYKNTSGDLTMTGDGGAAILTINYADAVINGNLTYTGNLTTVDDFIVVAANNTGAITDMGLLAQTSPTTFAGLRFDTISNTWQVSNSVYGNGSANAQIYSSLSTGGAIGGANTTIQFNDNNYFGGNVNLTFDYANSQLTLKGTEVFGNIGSTPTYTGNGVAVYNKAQGSGGTGLYVVSSSVNDELVSKSKAIVYGIIF